MFVDTKFQNPFIDLHSLNTNFTAFGTGIGHRVQKTLPLMLEIHMLNPRTESNARSLHV